MRITGGVGASRRLRGPARGAPLRPTPDALRERAFAVLTHHLPDARVLDLFAGTGAVALEALSRGAARAVLVEHHTAAVRVIRANLEAFGLAPPRAVVLRRPVADALDPLARRGEVFDLVWADPPFDRWREGLAALERAATAGLTASGAALCLECPARAPVTEACRVLSVTRELGGGASRLVILSPELLDEGTIRS